MDSAGVKMKEDDDVKWMKKMEKGAKTSGELEENMYVVRRLKAQETPGAFRRLQIRPGSSSGLQVHPADSSLFQTDHSL